ncbi:ChbG/HpnK family deacetylase [soil metagenome]
MTINQEAHLTPRRRIALCVDDFGLHEGVNSAVLLLMAQGRLGAASVLVDGPAAVSGAQRLSDASRDGLVRPDFGLHLNLSEALPAQPDKTPPMVRYGSVRRVIALAYLRLLSASAVRAEIDRQCIAFEKLFGCAPDYVDGHEHVHQLPIVRDELLQVLATRYGWSRPWLRSTRPPAGSRVLKEHVIAALGQRRLSALAGTAGYAQNAHLLGVHDFTVDPALYHERLEQWLSQCVDGDLLMCHASTWCHTADALLSERMAEYEVLGAAGFDRTLSRCGVELVRLSSTLQQPEPAFA